MIGLVSAAQTNALFSTDTFPWMLSKTTQHQTIKPQLQVDLMRQHLYLDLPFSKLNPEAAAIAFTSYTLVVHLCLGKRFNNKGMEK